MKLNAQIETTGDSRKAQQVSPWDPRGLCLFAPQWAAFVVAPQGYCVRAPQGYCVRAPRGYYVRAPRGSVCEGTPGVCVWGDTPEACVWDTWESVCGCGHPKGRWGLTVCRWRHVWTSVNEGSKTVSQRAESSSVAYCGVFPCIFMVKVTADDEWHCDFLKPMFITETIFITMVTLWSVEWCGVVVV